MNYDRSDDQDMESNVFETQNCMTCQTTKLVEFRDPGNRESYLRMALIELFFHFFFLILIIYISDNNNYKLLFDINNSVNSLFFDSSISPKFPFVTFKNISTHYHVWEYLKNHMLESLFWELEYKGRNITDEEIGYILYRNKLKYYVQIRQIRTKKYSCDVNSHVYECYHRYGPRDFTEKNPINSSGTLPQYNYKKINELGFKSFIGRAGVYGEEGYTLKLQNTKAKAKKQLDRMHNDTWIDRSTRVVFVEFILYNSELLNFCFTRLGIEFPLGGGVMTSSRILGVRVFHVSSDTSDILNLIMNLVFLLYTIYYLLLVLIEMMEFKLSYFLAFSSHIDLTIVTISIMVICMYFYGIFSTFSLNESTVLSRDAIFYGSLYSHCNTGLSIVFCLAFIKLFKYLNFNATLWSLSKTIYLCSTEVFCLILLTGELYIAFSILGTNLFGYEVEEFSFILYSLGAMVRVMLGDMDFKAFNGTLDIISFIFVVAYEMAIYFVFFALFLAILLTSYQQVGLLHQKQKFEMQMLEFTYRKIAQLFRKKYNEPPLISVKEWAKTMMDLGHPADATQIIVGKYKSQGIDKDSYLTYPQQDELTYELEYYLKSAYMMEKGRLLYMGFQKLKNLCELKSDPFLKTNSTTREITVVTKMLNQIKEAADFSPDERRVVLEKLAFELDHRRNLLLLHNEPYK